MISFTCPVCKHSMICNDRDAGQKFACPSCGQRVQVPSAPGAAAQGAAAQGAYAPRSAVPRSEVSRAAAESLPVWQRWIIVEIAVGIFLILGLVGAAFVFRKGSPTVKNESAGRQLTPPVDNQDRDDSLSEGENETPVERLTHHELYQRFQANPWEVKSRLVNRRVTVELKGLTWEVGDLQASAIDGVIELAAFKRDLLGTETILLIIRFKESKSKLVSQMELYAKRRERGEIVNFVVTGTLAIRRLGGQEYLVMNDVVLE